MLHVPVCFTPLIVPVCTLISYMKSITMTTNIIAYIEMSHIPCFHSSDSTSVYIDFLYEIYNNDNKHYCIHFRIGSPKKNIYTFQTSNIM